MSTEPSITSIFAAHNISVTETAVQDGPQVVRHLVKPPLGVRVAKLLGFAEEIEMALGIEGVSISREGAFLAVDIPRETRRFVEANRSQAATLTGLEFVAGENLAGEPVIIDLAKMPHLLVAGSTGSGKSVGINTILLNLVARLSHSELRLTLIDPKRVELGGYHEIPHVEFPVSGAGLAAHDAIACVEGIMSQRFARFERAGVRDIGEYNTQAKPGKSMHKGGPLPFEVVVIDEFADLMLGEKRMSKEIETMVVRIAQLGRAAGVHMILATQRPSADVFTGLIKANIPGRWVFRVNSNIDSRIALDGGGAESLLGLGDSLLALPGARRPVRLQAAAFTEVVRDEILDAAEATWPESGDREGSLEPAVSDWFEEEEEEEPVPSSPSEWVESGQSFEAWMDEMFGSEADREAEFRMAVEEHCERSGA